MKTEKLVRPLVVSTVLLSVVFAGSVKGQRYTAFVESDVQKVEVTASRLNVRLGPGKEFPVQTTIKKGQVVDVLGEMGEWYVVHLSNDTIGVISSDYVISKSLRSVTDSAPAMAQNEEGRTDNETMLALINGERAAFGLGSLELDDKIQSVAQLKAEDMVKNEYFAHDSPTYGTPFNMLKQFGVNYKAAGENIAGNTSIEAAHNQIMNSVSHRANVLNPRYTKIGIGIAEDPVYGKIIVQLFVE